MADTKSEQGVDRLVTMGRAARKASGEGRVVRNEKGVRPWNPKDPAKFGPARLDALRRVHEKFTRVFSNELGTLLRGTQTAVSEGDEPPEEELFSTYLHKLNLDQLDGNGFIAFSVILGTPKQVPANVSASGLAVAAEAVKFVLQGDRFVLAYDREFIFGVIDRMMGGTGRVHLMNRQLTAIEEKALSRLNDVVVQTLQQAWQVIDPHLRMEIDPDQRVNQLAAPLEVTAEIVFAVTGGAAGAELRGKISLGFPFATLEPLLSKLSPEHLSKSETPTEQLQADVSEILDRVDVKLEPVLGRARLSLREIINLAEGDVIGLERHTDQGVLIYIDRLPRYVATPGRRKKTMAVRVERVLTPEEQDFAALPEVEIGRNA